MKKQYQYENVKYGFAGRKWEFQVGSYCLRMPLRGGKDTADKVARLVRAGYLRTKGNGIDGLARASIYKLNSVNHTNSIVLT